MKVVTPSGASVRPRGVCGEVGEETMLHVICATLVLVVLSAETTVIRRHLKLSTDSTLFEAFRTIYLAEWLRFRQISLVRGRKITISVWSIASRAPSACANDPNNWREMP